MNKIIAIISTLIGINAFAQDPVTMCKYKADQAVETVNEANTGNHSSVYSTHNLEIAIDVQGFMAYLQGSFLLEDGNSYFLRAESDACDIITVTKE